MANNYWVISFWCFTYGISFHLYNNPMGRDYYKPHFIGEGTVAQKGEVI